MSFEPKTLSDDLTEYLTDAGLIMSFEPKIVSDDLTEYLTDCLDKITIDRKDLESILMFTETTPKVEYTGDVDAMKDRAIERFQVNAEYIKNRVEMWLR